jgi:hypothetical protein
VWRNPQCSRRCGASGGGKTLKAILEAQEDSADDLADGLTQWMKGEESPEAEVASIIFAEFVLLNRAYLKTKFKKREKDTTIWNRG